ncbi:MAG: hypothetical protein GX174_00740 [Lentisphaerae bacterium]|jgi:hypothetical protein|nr:hypothetical protein [Lentisphaerota bacterium]
MSILIFFTNLFFLMLWMRLWKLEDHEFYFNPLLSAPARMTDKMAEFLRPVLPGLPPRAIMAVTLLFLIIFRGVMLCSAGSNWLIVIGSNYAREFPVGDWIGCILFSLTDFMVFLLRLWGLALLVALMTPVPRRDRVTEAFRCFALPFSLLRRFTMIPVFLLLNVLLALHLQQTGRPFTGVLPNGVTALSITLNWQEPIRAAIGLSWLTGLAAADIFLTAYGAVMAVVFTSLLALLTQNRALHVLSAEALHLLLGGFSRRPLMVWVIDLTPLAYFFMMNMIYLVTTNLLRELILRIPWN